MSKLVFTALLASAATQIDNCVCDAPWGYKGGAVSTCVLSVDGGVPPDFSGPEPNITWAPPRIPVGLTSLQFEGGKFDGSGLTITIERAGSPAIQTQILTPSITSATTQLSVRPMWSGGMQGGAATLVVANERGKSSFPITLVALSFAAKQTISGIVGTNRWIQNGKYKGKDVVFRAYTEIDYVEYQMGTGEFNGTLKTPPLVPNASLAVTTDLDSDDTTDFFTVDTGKNLYRWRKNPSELSSDPLDFQKPWSMSATPTTLAAGSTSSNRVLIAVVDDKNRVYKCFYTKKNPPPLPGSEISTACEAIPKALPEAPKPLSLWAQDFSGSGRADILSLGVTGKLTLFRSDSGDTFTDATGTLANQTGWKALAVVDVDGARGSDLVGITDTNIVFLLNDGKGGFVSSSVPVSGNLDAVLVGDLDKNGRPDIVLRDGTGKLSALLNQSNGNSMNDGKFIGPVELNVNVGTGGLFILDGQDGQSRRLITLSPAAGELKSWDNTSTP